MRLAAGTRLGPYEIVSPLGAGGMGEVYRAHDPRLRRDVAVKIVSDDGAASPDRLQRFEQEARAVATLAHPHILAVYDLGSHESQPYVVFELLEGETLRNRLSRGPLPLNKAIEIAVQSCHALAAAHAHGIVHRDLKPENLFLARKGGVKLLDFGLAKLHHAPDEGGSEQPTTTTTDRGVWVGTAGYVSPEQLRGAGASPRSDVFALGAVLYEMLTGQRAFNGESRADAFSAILERDPPPMTLPGGPAPLPLDRVVRRCLEKDPEDRFQLARDVAFALEAVSGSNSGETVTGPVSPPPVRRRLWVGAAVLGGGALLGVGIAAGRKLFEKPAPTFKQLTFRRGSMQQARFAPDGRTLIYAAVWEGRPVELFQVRTDTLESRSLGLTHADVLAVSSQGQMAIQVDPSSGGGTLAVLPVSGTSPPREILTAVAAADWMPDGRQLCVSRVSHGSETGGTIELPPGNVIHRSSGFLGALRVSPDGRYAAFVDERAEGSSLVVLDLARQSSRTLVALTDYFFGIAWAPSSREVWFTQGPLLDAKDIHAVDLDGRRRLVHHPAADLSLLDIAPDGRALFHRSLCRTSLMVSVGQEDPGQDVSIANDSWPGALSADGRTLLIFERPDTYLRRVGGEPMRLAEGQPLDLAPDGRSALVLQGRQVAIVPVGPGMPRRLAGPAIPIGAIFVPPDGQRVAVWGKEHDGEAARLWMVSLEGAAPRQLDLILPPEVTHWNVAVSPDGRYLAGVKAPDILTLYPLEGGPTREAGRVPAGHEVRRWSGDGRSIFLANPGSHVPIALRRFDLATGRLAVLREVAPLDRAGIIYFDARPSADGGTVASVNRRCLTDLVLAEGLR
jgi:eukaryotic-like serine/threonine-protein kinase